FLGCLPESDQVVVLSHIVLTNFENNRVKALANPTDKLLRDLYALVQIIRMTEYLLSLLKSNPAPAIRPQALALSFVEFKAHLVYNRYTTNQTSVCFKASSCRAPDNRTC